MNQLEIIERLDHLETNAEKDIEIVFNRRIKELLETLLLMHEKFNHNGEISWTDVNKYNRFNQEMKSMAKALNKDYQKIIKTIQRSNERLYIEHYLMMAYLLQQSTGEEMGFEVPSTEVVQEALLNPIEFLTLPKIFEAHRNEIIRKLNIEIAQSIRAGEGYTLMAERIRKSLNWSRKKATLVARTEGGRVRSIANLKVEEQASKTARVQKVWMSSLDHRVRMAHRTLDGQQADNEGYYHYQGMKAKAPRLWGVASMDIQCRCHSIYMVNGKLPQYRRGRNYMDADYQRILMDKVDNLVVDEGMTFRQALKKANKEVKPPSKSVPYITYEDWRKKFAGDV